MAYSLGCAASGGRIHLEQGGRCPSRSDATRPAISLGTSPITPDAGPRDEPPARQQARTLKTAAFRPQAALLTLLLVFPAMARMIANSAIARKPKAATLGVRNASAKDD